MSASTVLAGGAGALGQEVAEARGVEQAGHADDALGREAEGVLGERRHLVERVRDHDDDGVGRGRAHARADLRDDAAVALEQVGAALARAGAGGPAVITTTSAPRAWS